MSSRLRTSDTSLRYDAKFHLPDGLQAEGADAQQGTITERAAEILLVWRVAARVLNRRELAVMRMLYVLGMTGQEVGDVLFVSRQFINQLEARCLKRLRAALVPVVP